MQSILVSRVLTTSFSLLLTSSSFAAELLVPRQFPTISAALAAANSGDSILVSAGMYPNKFTIEKQISLVAVDGPSITILDAQGQLGTFIGVSASGTGSTIQGFTVRNGNSVALSISASHLSVSDCLFENNLGGAAVLQSSSDDGVVSFDTCQFSGNRSLASGHTPTSQRHLGLALLQLPVL